MVAISESRTSAATVSANDQSVWSTEIEAGAALGAGGGKLGVPMRPVLPRSSLSSLRITSPGSVLASRGILRFHLIPPPLAAG